MNALSTLAGNPLWFATRATGLVAFLLLTGVVVLGIAATQPSTAPGWTRATLQGVHRNVALLACAFLVGHVLTTLLDGYVSVGWAAAVVPFAAGYRPFYVGLGTLALDTLLAVVVTSLLRRRLGLRTWRVVHWAAYAAWPLALAHYLGTGTDARRPWGLAVGVAALVAVAGAALVRVVAGRAPGSVGSPARR